MKYLLFSIFFIIFTGLIVVYINISNVNIKEKKEIPPKTVEKKEETTIVKLLATSKIKTIFPAKELYVKIDLNYIPKPKILYQTIIKNLDKYKLFGIEQILELNNIKYSIIKSKNDLKLFINFDKKSQARKIKKLFKNYDFNVELKEVTKI
jgi:hypothetical protein